MYSKIAKNKSLLKEYDNRTVYLKDGDEYQIQLFNPHDKEIAARVYIDNVPLSNNIIIKPGERIWLERYTDKPNKFKFATYTVDSDPEALKAISHNGEIKVEFYNRKTTVYTYYEPNFQFYSYSTCYSSNLTASSTTTPITTSYTAPIETGRTEAGDHSDQSFYSVNMEFEVFPFTIETIKILPESQRLHTKEDLKKVYCPDCGRKLKEKYKYCPYCGKKL